MPLTDAKVKNAKPKNKPYKIFDGDGLFLLVSPNDKKGWRFKYRFEGKEKLISLGSYPQVSLRKARLKKDAAREQVADGVNPSDVRKAKKAAESADNNTFEVFARKWHEDFILEWSIKHAVTILRRLELHVFPWLGTRAIATITTPELKEVLQKVIANGTLETAHRIRVILCQVFEYAEIEALVDRNPASALKSAFPTAKKKHLPAITKPKRVGELLRAIDAYQGGVVVESALHLAPLVFVRPGELRHAEWDEIDLETAEWNIPACKMKMEVSHLVPLSFQSISILKNLKEVTGTGKYVFPSARSSTRPMSDNAILAALRTMGFEKNEMSGHGFRAMARTILDEVLNVRPDFIEHQLAHAVRDPNGRAYNRTSHLDERRKMMQIWADYLDSLKADVKVIPLHCKNI